jgi:hypothetical protein
VFLDGDRIMPRQPDQIGKQRASLVHPDNAKAEQRVRRHDQGARHPGTLLNPPVSAEGATAGTRQRRGMARSPDRAQRAEAMAICKAIRADYEAQVKPRGKSKSLLVQRFGL